MPREPANQCDENGHASRSRNEILYCQRRHLRKITERRFATVGLPIGIGSKTGRGIERKLWRYGAETGWVERQIRLYPLEYVYNNNTSEIEYEHRTGVLFPIHFLLRPNTGEPIEEALERAQQALRNLRFTFVYTRHVRPKWNAERDQYDEEQGTLHNVVHRHDSFSG